MLFELKKIRKKKNKILYCDILKFYLFFYIGFRLGTFFFFLIMFVSNWVNGVRFNNLVILF